MKNIATLFILLHIGLLAAAQNTLPDVTLTDMNGKSVNAQTISNGKPFAICFWAVWNKSGLLELNSLMENYKDWHDQHDLEIYAICVDEEQRISRAKEYVEAHEWKYKVLFDDNGKMEHAMKINGVPHLMLFDAEGQLIWQEHSYHSGLEENFLEQVHKLK